MKDLHRIQDDAAAPEAELRLLRSAALDVPPRQAKARLLTALGVGSVTTAAAAASVPATTGVVVSKWLAVGALAGVLATGSVEVVKTRLDARVPPRPAASVAMPSRHAAPARVPPLPMTPHEGAPAVPMDETARPVPPAVARRDTTTSAPPERAAPAASTTLADEIAALDGARRHLESGDPRGALLALDAYGAAFEHPALTPEARLLRLEVLVQLGRAEEARRLGELLLTSDPANAHTQRIRSLLRQVGSGGAEIRSPSSGH